jgi:hypothetical protein
MKFEPYGALSAWAGRWAHDHDSRHNLSRIRGPRPAHAPGRMEIIADAKMSSPATLGDESSPWQSSASEEDLVHEESMLKRKLAILEEFMDNGRLSSV